ncbi:bifunctional folylpolyglutamate synthase/dihydrofolate synthase [Candidatus Palauibacter sp.]|uniref:bifunctional folylpolyglutamate synthase/dihydrofolate synthase n=1 Tax=Candidatus Palauibacter sp. TaxID=3101350 RepID=UPI003B01789B
MLTGGGGALAALLDPRPMTTARLGLERIEALLEALGRPERTFDAFHIAGTNGKGSTASFAARVLQAGGFRTGLYTSPHLTDVRERFVIDGEWIEEAQIEESASRIIASAASRDCTYFEVTTALAFLCFSRSGVDVAVIETGLGGRLDATNVLRPVGSAITPVGLDHMEALGASYAAIAAEKAGIFKPGVPASLGRMPGEALDMLERRAVAADTPIARLGREAEVSDVRLGPTGTRFRYSSGQRPDGMALATWLTGRHQADNAALALLMLDRSAYAPDEGSARRGVAAARLPGRFEVWRPGPGRTTLVFDIAHNPAAADILCETITSLSPARPRIAVVGMLADKDWRAVLSRLALDMDAIILTRPAGPQGRRWDPVEAAAWLSHERGRVVEAHGDVAEAVLRGRALAGPGTLVVTGSAHTVGEARVLPALADARPQEDMARHALRSETGTTDEGGTHAPRGA